MWFKFLPYKIDDIISIQTFSLYAKMRITTDHMSEVNKDKFSIVDPLIWQGKTKLD